MRVTEAVDDRIGVVITGAAVPTGETRVRTELDHAERARCTGIRVPMPGSADKRIYIASQILLRQQCDRQDQQESEDCQLLHGAIARAWTNRSSAWRSRRSRTSTGEWL